MSNVFTLRQRNTEKEDLLLGRIITMGAIIITAGLVLYLAARFLLLPFTAIRHVIVESDAPLSEREVLSLSGLQGSESFYSLKTLSIQNRLEANPLIRKARVEKLYPDTLRIVLVRRQAVALVLGQAGEKTVPALVDRDGVIFKLGATAAEVDLPVISGLAAGEAAMGSALPQAYRSVFSDLASLRSRSPSLYRLISEVHLVSMSGSSSPAAAGRVASSSDVRPASSAAPELLLYLLSSPVPIRARGPIDEALLKSSLMVLDLLSNQGLLRDIQELDVRSGDAVYRMKEG